MSEDDAPARWNAETVAVQSNKPATGASTSAFDAIQPRFDDVAELGRGGMGRVAEARDRALDRTVAIKHMLAPAGSEGSTGLARFEREVKITARLQHPGIVPVLDAGRDADGHPYYVMRKIDGVALAERVTKRSVRERVALIPAILPAVDAVAYAHAQGIVHRDIKPWNILLGGFGEALMIDWGLARDLASTAPESFPPSRPAGDAALTQLGSAYGTPGFMAPEQARGEAADRRADVYSLGATLYFVLAASLPFAGVEPTVAIDKAAAGEMPDMSRLDDEVPVELVAIVTKALSPEQDDRYADAGELATDLRRFVAGQLVAAHRYTAWQRVRRWIAKHRLVTAISLAAIAVIGVGGVWSVDRIVHERDTAQTSRTLAETRADELVVDRARSLVSTDGTSALAALRALPLTSPQWAIARDIVRAAIAGGIERMVSHHNYRITAVAFSPGGRLASTAVGTTAVPGVVQVHDLAAATTIEIAGVEGNGLGWLDDHVLLVWHHESGLPDVLTRVDVDRRSLAPVPIGPYDEITVDHGRAVIHRRDNSVATLASDGTIAEVGTHIDVMAARGGRIALANRKQVTLVELDGTRRDHPFEFPTVLYHIDLAASGRHIGILAFKSIYEFSGDAAPASWPTTSDAENQIAYVDDHLYAWSSDGSGVAELTDGRSISRWLVAPAGRIGLVAATSDQLGVFATRSGRIAYASDLGVVELKHRPEPISRIAYDATGRRLAIGTDEGDVEVIELSFALPEIRTLGVNQKVYGIGHDRLVIGTEVTDPVTMTKLAWLDQLETVELDTGRHHKLPPIAMSASLRVHDDLGVIIAGGGILPDRSVFVTDLDGKVLFQRDHVGSFTTGARVVFSTDTNDVFELDAHWQPHLIAHTDSPLFMVQDTSAGIIVGTAADRTGVLLVDASGPHRVEFPMLKSLPHSFHRSPDGTWWVVEDFRTLWRIPSSGAPTPIPLRQEIHTVKSFGDRIYANGNAAIFELALDGTVLRATSSVGLRGYLDAGYILATDTGVVEVNPAANVRRTLELGRKPDRVHATPDGRVMAASVSSRDTTTVAIWRDRVPDDAAAIPGYIARLTNAHLDPGSDELRWDARQATPVSSP